MAGTDEDKAQILKAYRDMYRAMLEGRTKQLGVLLDDQYSLTHITGYRQPKREDGGRIPGGGEARMLAREGVVKATCCPPEASAVPVQRLRIRGIVSRRRPNSRRPERSRSGPHRCYRVTASCCPGRSAASTVTWALASARWALAGIAAPNVVAGKASPARPTHVAAAHLLP